MKIFLKIVAFIILIAATTICGWKSGREMKKSNQFGDEYLGQSKQAILAEFGEPEISVQKSASKYNDDFEFFYDGVNCHPEAQVTYLKYEQFWNDVEFWLLNTNSQEIVVLVK
ncbi:hypothetical protein [Nonlabens ponticola]|uniref:Uncharacterized protein n=1 Tax=Nonlabens ponticola TaxID=2496866 RepID=A0A3S9MY03_9FLAO|nr:hypothetical protein [Nonlabens ponticola]AZQ43923.1 hypothetical protein EJ995_06635 [Nonlabens ponticola]